MRAYRPLVAALAERELRGWRGTVRTHERMQALTLEIMVRVVFGSESRALHDAIAYALGLARSAPRLVAMALVQKDVGPYRTFHRAVRRVDALILDLVEQPSPPDSVLALLKEARHEDGSPPHPRELRDQLVTLLAAGHETTAAALAWAFERRARTPGARLHDDAYREAFVKEVLRVRPVLSVAPREVMRPFAVAGTTLPPGVQVAASIYLAHRRPESWGDPLAFRPERWLEGDAPPYSFIPFGGGVRRCVGAAFAAMEMGEVLRVAAEHDLFAPARGERVIRRGVSLTPARGGTVGVA
jgi:cytochrome P450